MQIYDILRLKLKGAPVGIGWLTEADEAEHKAECSLVRFLRIQPELFFGLLIHLIPVL